MRKTIHQQDMQGTSWWHTNMGWRWGSENYICSLDKLHFPRENKHTRETRNTISSPVLWRNFTRTTTEISNRKEWDMSESYIWEKKRMSGTVQTYQHRTIMTGTEGKYSSSYTRCFPTYTWKVTWGKTPQISYSSVTCTLRSFPK